MAVAGADLEQLDDLRRDFDRRADQLERLTRTVSGEIGGLRRLWLGADGVEFVRVWETRHRPLLLRAVTELRAAGDTVERNRNAQQQTSAVAGETAAGFLGGLPSFNPPGLGWLGDRVDDGVDWLGDQADDGLGWLGDRAEDGVNWFGDRADDVGDGIDWLGDQADVLWGAANDRAEALWGNFKAFAGELVGELGDRIISDLLSATRAIKWLVNTGAPAGLLGNALFGPLGGLASGVLYRNEIGPRLNDWWNTEANPWLVGEAFGGAEYLFGSDTPPTGDLEARQQGGAFPVRTSASFDPNNPDLTLPRPFSVDGGTPTEVGRNSIIRTLQDTSSDYGQHQIYADEFQVIDHGDNRYTVVLPGVTDLTNPNEGLNVHNRSVRDTDFAAAASAGSADVADNLYAQMVRDYIRDEVPAGASLAIVGHSYGGDTAVDLAADPNFNGRRYNVTHVVSAAYHSEPQLPHVKNGTEVLVLQNTRDIPVVVEELGHASSNAELSPDVPEGIVVEEFEGGWKGVGHHQDNYIDYVEQTDDDSAEAFFASWSEAGYGEDGEVTAVDVSLPG